MTIVTGCRQRGDVFASKRGDNTLRSQPPTTENPKAGFVTGGNFEPSQHLWKSTVSAGTPRSTAVPTGESTVVDSTISARCRARGLISRSTALSPHARSSTSSEATGRKVRNSTMGPALEKVVDGFLPFENPSKPIATVASASTRSTPPACPLARRIARPTAPCSLRWCTSASAWEPTARAALLCEQLRPRQPGRRLTYALGLRRQGDHFTATRRSSAWRRTSTRPSAVVEPDSLGKAQITVVESEIEFPQNINPSLKSIRNGTIEGGLSVAMIISIIGWLVCAALAGIGLYVKL